LELTSAAINNALKFAVGKHSYQIPLTLEQVYLEKNLRKPARQSEVFHYSKMKTKQVLRTNNIKTITPKNLENALEILSGKKFQILAGGTDIIVQARMKTELQNLLNIYSLQELKEITETENEIIIGSAVTFSKLISNKIIQKHFPILVKACSSIGSTQIRNRATIGGNIINAAPCADSVPPLILRSAELVLQSKSENRKIPIKDFIIKHYKTQIKTDEILISISIPKPSNKKYYHRYSQLGRRNAMNITRMSISAMISFASNKNIEECYLVDGSLFSCSQRLTNVENFLIGKPLNEQTIEAIEKPLSEKIEKEIGNRWSSEYKKPVFINMCKDALREIAADFHG